MLKERTIFFLNEDSYKTVDLALKIAKILNCDICDLQTNTSDFRGVHS